MGMFVPPPGWDPSREGDEWLVWYAQDGACRAAADALALRYVAKARGHVARLLQAAGLQAADVEDAVQEMFFAVRDAIKRYDLRRYGAPRPCQFRTFVYRVIFDHVRNVLARHGRARRRGEAILAAVGQALAASTPRAAVHWMAHSADWGDEPSLAAQKQEALDDLGQAVAGLDEAGRGLAEDLLAGRPTDELARERGCSAYAVRRKRRKVVIHLRVCLRGHRD